MCGRGTLEILSTVLHLRTVGVGTGQATGTQCKDLSVALRNLVGGQEMCVWCALCVHAHTHEYPGVHAVHVCRRIHLGDLFQEVLEQI